jgi:hypothetical protein
MAQTLNPLIDKVCGSMGFRVRPAGAGMTA